MSVEVASGGSGLHVTAAGYSLLSRAGDASSVTGVPASLPALVPWAPSSAAAGSHGGYGGVWIASLGKMQE